MYVRRCWYEKEDDNVDGLRLPVLSTRVRVARNISSILFPNRMSVSDYLTLRTSTARVLRSHQFDECKTNPDAPVAPSDFLVSVGAPDKPNYALGNVETGQIIVLGDEDHFRISTVTRGLALSESLESTIALESFISKNFQFAFEPNRFGFLTASIANAGLAMRMSVWMHLPGLLLTDKWSELLPLLVSMDISVRGINGEESDVMAGMVQLSNRTSYGYSALEITAKIHRVVHLLEEAERLSLSILLREYKDRTFDYLKWMNVLEQPFVLKDDFIHAVSAALLASRLGYNVRFETSLALRVLIAGFKSMRPDGFVQMQVVRSFLKDIIMN